MQVEEDEKELDKMKKDEQKQMKLIDEEMASQENHKQRRITLKSEVSVR